MISSIKIISGKDKSNQPEKIKETTIYQGEIVGIVGPTGSGKSALIEDIEQLAQLDTATARQILVNNKVPTEELRHNPKKKLVAQLSQNMNFLADMTVEEFLILHAKCRGKDSKLVDKVIYYANSLTGESITKHMNLTILSGGQSRSLMVADVAFISNSPIVLIDEIENAGIKKHEALELLSGNGKIILVVTHDPVLALLTKRRLVMKNGGIEKLITTSIEEKCLSDHLNQIDRELFGIRETIRHGETISSFIPRFIENKMQLPFLENKTF